MAKVRARVLEGRSKEDRKQQRKALGPLKGLTVSSKTNARYKNARERFYDFLHKNQLEIPTRRDQFDALVSEYVEFLWSEGEGRGLAADTIAGLQDLDPKLKGHFQQTWRLMKTWNTQEIPNRAPPLPEQAILAMAGWGFFHGHFNFSVSILLCFMPC